METNQTPFLEFIAIAFDKGHYATDDVIAFVLPLFRRVLGFHESGLVGAFEKPDALFRTDHHLDMEATSTPLEALPLPMDPVPAYLPGYTCFELAAGHHDPQTDIFCLGLVLGSLSLGLNLQDRKDFELFVRIRINPSLHQERIHPTIGRLITEMTELDRSKRTQDLYDVIRRLQYYRDYDPEKQTDLSQVAGWVNKAFKERNTWILNKLRNRLFDTSRRNRLLYYKPNMRFVNLTAGSVPLVLHHQSIRPELLITWNDDWAGKAAGTKEVVLNKYLRFEDHGYLPAALDRLRVESRHALQEYGFSQLKLVIAFLHWHNLKEEKEERIQSPLLLIPIELKKNKKVKEDHYVLKFLDNAAEVNPVLAGQLKELYGIRLPDLIDLEEISLNQFYALLKEQIEEANQGISLHHIASPDIPAIHESAREMVNLYKRRMRKASPSDATDPLPETHSSIPAASPLPGIPLSILPELAEAELPETDFPETDLPDANLPEPDLPEPEADLPEENQPDIVLPNTSPVNKKNPYNWDFDVCNMVLGNFNYKKMSLVRDYNQVIDQEIQHHTFEALFSDQPKSFPGHSFDLNRPDDWFHVVTADPSQTRAILQSRAGYSYIIQGPPGTGKSQTITNLIADFVARGKSILFVCEKRAALDVVYHRLKQHGLDELCCYIHDSQRDKKEFIKNLKQTYEHFSQEEMDLVAIKTKRQSLLGKINDQLRIIKEFHACSLTERRETGIPVRKLIERILELRKDLVSLTPGEEELLPSYSTWQEAAPTVMALATALEDAGAEPVFAEHPFSKVHEDIFMAENPRHLLDKLLQEAGHRLEEIDAVIARHSINPAFTGHPETLKTLVQFAVLLYPLALAGNLSLADPTHPGTQEFERQVQHYKRKQSAYREAAERNVHWRQKFSEQDVWNSLPVAAKYEGSFRGALSGRWHKLKKQLQEHYDFAAHAVRPTCWSILELLKLEYEALSSLEQTRQQLQELYHLDNVDTVRLSLEVLHAKKGEASLEYLEKHPEATSLIAALQTLHRPLNSLESQLSQCLQAPGDLAAIRDDLENIRLNLDALPDFLPFLRSVVLLPEEVKQALRQLPLNPRQAEAAVARKSLHQFYLANRDFAGIDGVVLDKTVQQLGQQFKKLQELNADLIRALVRERFLQHIDLANMAASQLTEEQKKFKKAYNEGRKILENEFGKSKRFKSIRELSARESGMVLKDIKPVWLMSPYSVSDSLPLDSDHFDVVIFDEASQITLEEGIPALYRTGQTIIVGDEKQMPPTDFFSARAEDPDDLARIDDQEGDEWLSHDADSLLAQGTRKLNSVLLSWHYRSRFETLISFSNHAFYEGNLLTIPDKTIHQGAKGVITITSKEDAPATVDALFDRSISFHRHLNSVYEKRRNPAEAEYIAHLVRELLNRGVPESVGIVAFSQEQQLTIESALDDLAGKDPAFGRKLEEAFNRTENDQFTGLIIKNLENIQGDERDIIIMSVCYGFDARKKMLMNFGPINRKGGEKRLNVLFSRARKHMTVVSSIRHQDITNEYNEGANYLRRFLEYAERISRGDMEMAGTILDRLAMRREQEAPSPAPSVLVQQIKAQIRLLGYEAAEQVGQSDFKCSLGVKANADEDEYALGILLDDDLHYRNRNLIEQYYQRPVILENSGWRILVVFSKDWLHQPQKVIELIHREMQAAIKAGQEGVSPAQPSGAGKETDASQHAMNGEEGSLVAGTGLEIDGATDREDPPSTPSEYDRLNFQQLHFSDETGDKFWEAATDGNKLVIRWGRKGRKGQTQLKTFSGEVAARTALEKLLQEKIKKGYTKPPAGNRR